MATIIIRPENFEANFEMLIGPAFRLMIYSDFVSPHTFTSANVSNVVGVRFQE
jgi:hypothetical protein